MKRVIIPYEKEMQLVEGDYIMIPDGAVITITENCGGCSFCVKASAGTKPVCGHPLILAKRPYADGPEGTLTRAVTYDVRPEWCPL